MREASSEGLYSFGLLYSYLFFLLSRNEHKSVLHVEGGRRDEKEKGERGEEKERERKREKKREREKERERERSTTTITTTTTTIKSTPTPPPPPRSSTFSRNYLPSSAPRVVRHHLRALPASPFAEAHIACSPRRAAKTTKRERERVS